MNKFIFHFLFIFLFAFIFTFLFTLININFSQLALAQVQNQTPDSGVVKKNPCKGDIIKFCKNTEKRRGEIIKCLKKHESELSEECRDRETKFFEKRERIKEAKESLRKNCTADVKKFCKGVKAGRGEIKKCLNIHENELSEMCRDTINEIQKK
ncbi:MAG: hypothetical protein HQK51_07670 [Oligoflexia bacterium]|nr:hypothetical protein [Oligoflexia bacterium]